VRCAPARALALDPRLGERRESGRPDLDRCGLRRWLETVQALALREECHQGVEVVPANGRLRLLHDLPARLLVIGGQVLSAPLTREAEVHHQAILLARQ